MENKGKKTKVARKKPEKATNGKKKKVLTRGQKIRRNVLIALGATVGLFVVGVCVFLYVYLHGFWKSSYLSDEEVTIYSDYTEEGETPNSDGYLEYDIDGDGVVDVTESAAPEANESQLADISNDLDSVSDLDVRSESYVTNILLIGRDVRQDNWNGNSDAVILVSINTKTKTIYMTSFMRDSYAVVPGYGVNKLNYAHAVGGGPLLVQTIESNYKVDIDYYVSVNFNAFMSIVDTFGGLQLTVTDEARVMNKYIKELNKLYFSGVDVNTDTLSGGGTYQFNGKQVLAYARNRYVGSDYARTQRQRIVLQALFAKMQQMSVTQANEVLQTVAAYTTHNIPGDTFANLLLNVPTYLQYDILQDRIPYDGLYSSMSIGNISGLLVPNFAETISRLQSTIFATE